VRIAIALIVFFFDEFILFTKHKALFLVFSSTHDTKLLCLVKMRFLLCSIFLSLNECLFLFNMHSSKLGHNYRFTILLFIEFGHPTEYYNSGNHPVNF